MENAFAKQCVIPFVRVVVVCWIKIKNKKYKMHLRDPSNSFISQEKNESQINLFKTSVISRIRIKA